MPLRPLARRGARAESRPRPTRDDADVAEAEMAAEADSTTREADVAEAEMAAEADLNADEAEPPSRAAADERSTARSG